MHGMKSEVSTLKNKYVFFIAISANTIRDKLQFIILKIGY